VTVSEKNLSPRDLKNYIDWKFGELPEANGITVDECPYPTVPLRRLLKISIKQRVNQAYPDFAKEYSVANAVDMLDNWKTTQITHISPSNNPSSSPASSSDPGTTTHFPLPSVEEQIFPGAHIPGQGSPSSATGGGGPSSIEDGKESQLNFKTAKLN
jgi:hypothetical protein